MTPTLEAFLKRLARLTAETNWAIEQQRGAIWATQAHRGHLISGPTLRLYAKAVCERSREMARALSKDVALLHLDHQAEAYEALHTCVVQISLRAQSDDRVKAITGSSDALRNFRSLLDDCTNTTTGLLRDLREGFDVQL